MSFHDPVLRGMVGFFGSAACAYSATGWQTWLWVGAAACWLLVWVIALSREATP